MVVDRFGRSFEFFEGANSDSRTIWDLKPEGGGPPRRLRLDAGNAGQAVERDPERYCFAFGDEPPKA